MPVKLNNTVLADGYEPLNSRMAIRRVFVHTTLRFVGLPEARPMLEGSIGAWMRSVYKEDFHGR